LPPIKIKIKAAEMQAIDTKPKNSKKFFMLSEIKKVKGNKNEVK
jgi:hypothetical protein